MGLKNEGLNKTYANILGDGSIRVKGEEGQEGVVKREYETSDGRTGVKFEYVYTELSGIITDIELYDGDYGVNLILTIQDEGEDIFLSMGAKSNFGSDLMKKLPNVDLLKEVTLKPYAFPNERGKQVKGITVYQEANKILNFFYEASEVEGKKGKNINDFPEPDGDTTSYSKDDWKMYFLKTDMFLARYTEEKIFPKLINKPIKDSTEDIDKSFEESLK